MKLLEYDTDISTNKTSICVFVILGQVIFVTSLL